ncbi:MAG: rhomboid family intramembrane serine protease [Rhodospirillaceae bacterium]|nr:rhomboid family intramembrane serine protease [Rhodospirillaceae bacterium]
MIPVGSTAPRARVAIVVLAMVAVCCAVFVWQLGLSPQDSFLVTVRYALIPGRYSDPSWAVLHGLDPADYLPFFSMAFLHGGWLHLLANMWTLWLLGRAVESRMGGFRFALLYVLSALLASTAHAWINANSYVPTLGASGAIAGVVSAHAALFPRSRIVILVPIVIIPLFFRVPTLVFAAIWFGLQVLQGATSALGPDASTGIAWWAHIGGFVAGLVFVALLTPPETDDPPPPASPPWERRSRTNDQPFGTARAPSWPHRRHP